VADADQHLVARTALRLGLTAAALVGVVVVVLAVVLGVVVVHRQERDDRALVTQTVTTATSPDDPPTGVFLTVVTDGQYASTLGLPRGLPDVTALVDALSRGRTTQVTTHLDGRHLLLLTRPRPGGAVQAAYDLRSEDQLRRDVVEATAAVGGAGLLAAAAIALLLSRRAVRPLAQALVLQRSFVADASHELRTPLTLLTTRAQLLRRSIDRGLDEQARHDAQALVDDAGRLADVVDDLLLAADPRADDRRAAADVGALAAEVVASAGPYAADRAVSLTLERVPAVAQINAVAVRRAILALVDNAVQHTPHGGSVAVDVAAAPRSVTVTVTDTGSGVDPADVDRVFRRFSSGEQGASRRGYGLGLALVRDVAARHGGSVRLAETARGAGARFVLELPR
jgi:signal transduction histidine kinase